MSQVSDARYRRVVDASRASLAQHRAATPPAEPPVGGVATVPNAITLARICAVPLAVWLLLHRDFSGAFWLFIAAGMSDAVDGWLARRRGGGSALGAILDPVADKALLVTLYIVLAAVGALPDWLAIMVVFRDALIVGGVLVLAVLGQPATIRPLYISKCNTVMQILLVAFVLLLATLGVAAPRMMVVLVWLVAATTLASGGAYLWVGARSR